MARRNPPVALHTGDLLSSRFRLVEPLARGSSATVWRATDQLLGRPVAVKALNPERLGDRTGRARMQLEAKALASLCHPHVAAVYDLVMEPAGRGRSMPFLVLELVDGVTVSSFDHLPWRAAVTVAAQTADALAAAHERGVVHRDISAANILLTAEGVKVVDFGICAFEGDPDSNWRGDLVGTPAYIAPERIAGLPVGPAVDIYAVGVMLYYSLAGRWPWQAVSTADFVAAHAKSEPEPLRVAQLPAEVADACLRCLDKDPQRRPTADQLRRLLAPFTDPQSIAALLRTAPPPHLQPTLIAFIGGTTAKQRRRGAESEPSAPRRRRAATAIAATVVAAVAVSLTGWNPSSDPTVPQAVGPAVAAPAPVTECLVSYQATAMAGGRFHARLTVTNTGAITWPAGWQLTMTTPAKHHLDTLGWRHDGATAISPPGASLPSGRSADLALTGHHYAALVAPTGWQVDSQPCAASTGIDGPAARQTDRPTTVALAKPRPPAKPAQGQSTNPSKAKPGNASSHSRR